MITGEMVREAMIAKGIGWAEVHKCSLCNCPVGYIRDGDRLFYRSNCNCIDRWTPDDPREWEDAAHHINMQDRNHPKYGDIGAREAQKFGLTLEPVEIDHAEK